MMDQEVRVPELVHYEGDKEAREEIEKALVGRRIVGSRRSTGNSTQWSRVTATGVLELDDGSTVEFIGHDGGCFCNAGCYDLTHLGEVDNVITAVHFEDDPGSDAKYDPVTDGLGSYKVFVVADDKRINLVTFEGTDGNGYYGTGFYVRIRR